MPLTHHGSRRRPPSPLLLALSTGLLLASCQTPPPGLTISATALPAPPSSPTSTRPAPSPTPPPRDSGWASLAPGLERRVLYVVTDERPVERIVALRLEPDQFMVGVGYSPGLPRSLSAWSAETGAAIVVNGGYFTPDFEATGLIVTDGRPSGVSYGAFAGMLAIVDGAPEIRWLAEQPYDPNEPLEAAVQSFPLLIRPGDREPHPAEDGVVARRTVVALDDAGRLLFILTEWGYFSLHGLSNFLLESDLDLSIALNLDGGGSSGLYLDPAIDEGSSGATLGVPALSPLPAVILVYPRSNDPDRESVPADTGSRFTQPNTDALGRRITQSDTGASWPHGATRDQANQPPSRQTNPLTHR